MDKILTSCKRKNQIKNPEMTTLFLFIAYGARYRWVSSPRRMKINLQLLKVEIKSYRTEIEAFSCETLWPKFTQYRRNRLSGQNKWYVSTCSLYKEENIKGFPMSLSRTCIILFHILLFNSFASNKGKHLFLLYIHVLS